LQALNSIVEARQWNAGAVVNAVSKDGQKFRTENALTMEKRIETPKPFI
jgi:hypothetical protein